MENRRSQKLQSILKRLGKAVHGSVVNSDEVQACLRELHENRWDAVMLLEASVACSEEAASGKGNASIHIHTRGEPARISYRINLQDAAFLSSVGISPSRYRSPATLARPVQDEEPDR
jgi:hypothetical protein